MIPVARRLVLQGVLSVFAAGLLARTLAFATSVSGKVAGVVKAATVTPARRNETDPEPEPQPVVIDLPIEPGSTIATKGDSAVDVAFADGSAVTIGARTKAVAGPPEALVSLISGNMRVVGAGEVALLTPTLKVTLHQAEMLISVKDNGGTICGVVSGRITCTSIKKGTAVEVPAGSSVAWAEGSFGGGVTAGVYHTGDLAVDDGLAAARAKWAPDEVIPVPAPKPPQ